MLDNDILSRCLRSTVNEDEFDEDKVGKIKFSESLDEGCNSKSTKVESDEDDTDVDEDDFDDTMYADADEGDDDFEGEDIPVIDTELKDDEEEYAELTDYIGKYVVVCPICLNPIFSDKPSGEIYCPVCDQDVEVETAQGKVVSPDEEATDEGTPDEDGNIDDIATDAVDDMTDEGNAESGEAGTEEEVHEESLKESVQVIDKEGEWDVLEVVEDTYFLKNTSTGEELKANANTVLDLDGNPIKNESLTESVNVSVCPEGSVTVTSDDAEATVTVAPTNKTDAESEPTCYAPVVPDDVPVPEDDADEVVEVDDYDTDSFDAQINEMLPEMYEDEGIRYESTKVVRNGKGLIIEGVIKSGSNSLKVKFSCNESKSRSNTFKLEGIDGLSGKIMTECVFDKDSKVLKTESLKYKFLAKVEGKSRILRSK